MKQPKFVNREEELSIFKKIIKDSSEKGKIVSLVGIRGIGKTTFLSMLHKNFEGKKNRKTLCVMDGVLAADTPLSFFERFFSNIQARTRPTRTKFQSFFKKHADTLQLFVNVGSAAAGIPSASGISELISAKKIDTLPSLESELISMLKNFAKSFPDEKLVILIDDIDKSEHIDDFIVVLEDIRSNLTKNITIVVSLTENTIESDEIILLQKFDEEGVKEFIKKNLPKVKKENLYQIVEKSGCYPLALHWLWENYRRDVDINSLLLRLSREGFLQQLQANFLNNLEDDELRIMKICAALDLIDSRIISKVSGLEQNTVDEILEYLTLSSVIVQINYQELANKQSIEIYVLDEAFRKLVESSFGRDIELNKRILQYYFDALSTNLYPIRNQVIGLTINQLERIGDTTNPKITPQQVLLNLDLDVFKKFDISSEIISHYWIGHKKEKIKDYVAIQFELAKQIDDPNYKKLYTNQAELNRLVVEERYQEAKQLCDETVRWFESFNKNEMSEQNRESFTKAINFMNAYGSLLISKEGAGEAFLQALFGNEAAEKFMKLSSNKIFQCSFLIPFMESLIATQNFEAGIDVGEECLKILNSITKTDMEEFEKLNNSKISTELQLLEYAAKYDLGILYFLKLVTSMQSNPDKKELKQNLEKALEYLEIAKSDPVRGRFYYEVQHMLDKLNEDNTMEK